MPLATKLSTRTAAKDKIEGVHKERVTFSHPSKSPGFSRNDSEC